jgi:GDPmannose 4,6-dehydratase
VRALVTGITGQSGSYLAELLLSKGYEVHGVVRRSSVHNTGRIDHILNDLVLHDGDMADTGSLRNIVRDSQPDEIYNLAAQSFVQSSFSVREYTADIDALGCMRLLEAARDYAPNVKFYQASTSELYGKVVETPQTETTPFYPRSPYGIAKLFAYWSVVNYRESCGMHASNGILFNHESPRRGESFVSRKIVKAVVQIIKGKQDTLALGNLDARRDWGYAPEYVEGMWRMLQQDAPGDYVLATGETHTIREFLDEAFGYFGIDQISWAPCVVVDPKHFRPAEVDILLGDASKAKRVLGWEPKVKFKELVRIMVEAELTE